MEIKQGVSDTTKETLSESGRSEEQSVSYETHRRLLSQRKADQEHIRELEERMRLFEDEKKRITEDDLKKKEEFKKLVDIREKELERERAEKESIKKNLFDTWKLQAVKDRLPGKLSRPEYFSFVNLEGIAVNPDSMEIDPESVDSVVNDFLEKHSRLIDRQDIKIPPSSAPKTFSKISYDEWAKLPLKEKKARYKDVIETK